MGIRLKFRREDIIEAIEACVRKLKADLEKYEKEQSTFDARVKKFYAAREKFVWKAMKDCPKQVRSAVHDHSYTQTCQVELSLTLPYSAIPKEIMDNEKPQSRQNAIDRHKRELVEAEGSLKKYRRAQDEMVVITTMAESRLIDGYMNYL